MFFFNVENIWVVPFYPLLAFFLIVLGRAFGLIQKKQIAMLLTVGATFLGLLHALGAVQWLVGSHGAVTPIEHNLNWLHMGRLSLSVGTLLDSMSVMMLFVVTFISLFIQIYTHGYMDHDKGYCKFYAYLALFNFSMLGLVLSSNLFQIYIFWELVGVSSYLLIGFWFTRPSAAAAAVKAFLMNRLGDFGFLIGILALLFFTWTAWQNYLPSHYTQALLSFSALPDILNTVFIKPEDATVLSVIAILLFMGPMAKSAQVPFHTWLPDAMEGPTPISALIHAATMVAAGVFLIGRIYPIFTISGMAMPFVAAIGLITALVGATIALTQTDIKKALAYSTMSQLGYMVCAMGIGAFTAGLFHLFTHAFFKALLFLCSGSVIHACEDEQDMRKMGGLLGKLPLTGWTYLIGTVAIAGLPMTSGFFSKDMILDAAHSYHPIVYWTLVSIAGMTSFYMFRTFFLTFTGNYRGEAHVHHENPWMTTPLVVLAVPALLIGWLMSGFGGHLLPIFGEWIHYGSVRPEETQSLAGLLTAPTTLTSLTFVFGGLGLSWFFYATEAGRAIPGKITGAPFFKDIYTMFCKKWYFDDLYQGFVDNIYLAFANASAQFDRLVIDGLVNLTGQSVVSSGQTLKLLQSGRVQTYIIVLFLGVVVLSLLMFYGLL